MAKSRSGVPRWGVRDLEVYLDLSGLPLLGEAVDPRC